MGNDIETSGLLWAAAFFSLLQITRYKVNTVLAMDKILIKKFRVFCFLHAFQRYKLTTFTLVI